jgi:TolB protein
MKWRSGVVLASIVVLAFVASSQSQPSTGMIAFQVYGERDAPTYDGIYLINADGSGRHRLPNQPINSAAPRWSPDGNHLLILAAGPSFRLFVIDADGKNRRLVMSKDRSGRSPGYADWSPDGRRIAVVVGTPCSREILCNASLYVFSLTTRSLKRVARNVLGASVPAWSPNGRQIAFTRSSGEPVLVDPDGRHQRMLASGAYLFWPAWSPDGRTIAFTAVDGNRAMTYTVGVDGRNARALLPGDDGPMSWSPDGKRIVFARNSDSGDLYVADATGKHAIQITSDLRDETLPDWRW